MRITQSTVPGGGVLHDIVTRGGEAFRVLVEPSGERVLVIEAPDSDRPLAEVLLESDEADAVAEILHSAPIVDRVASLERRLEEYLSRAAGPPGPACRPRRSSPSRSSSSPSA